MDEQLIVTRPLGEAWAQTYLNHAERLMRLATVVVGPDQAHDVVADAVHHPSWDSVAEPGAYLARAVINEANAQHRSAGRRRHRERRALSLVPGDGTTAEIPLEMDLHRALRLLSTQQRAVVYLAYWEDRSIPQIAAELGVGEGSVRKQLARAKATLKEHLDG